MQLTETHQENSDLWVHHDTKETNKIHWPPLEDAKEAIPYFENW